MAPTLIVDSLFQRDVAHSGEIDARVVVYGEPGSSPQVTPVRGSDAGSVIEALCDTVAEHALVPTLAARELVENLIHADMRGATVSILDGGATLRVSDRGPGIADVAKAQRPGFTTAGPSELRYIKGVGAGLPTARALIDAEGGSFEIDTNLDGGTVVTLGVPLAPEQVETQLPPRARAALALLLELDGAESSQVAAELGVPRVAAGRLLAELEQSGLVARDCERRTLTGGGRELVATLFS